MGLLAKTATAFDLNYLIALISVGGNKCSPEAVPYIYIYNFIFFSKPDLIKLLLTP